jgi:hypothetical protein
MEHTKKVAYIKATNLSTFSYMYSVSTTKGVAINAQHLGTYVQDVNMYCTVEAVVNTEINTNIKNYFLLTNIK